MSSTSTQHWMADIQHRTLLVARCECYKLYIFTPALSIHQNSIMVNRTATEDTWTPLSSQLSTQRCYQLWTTSSEMIQKVILLKTTSDTGESILFLSIKHNTKHCNNSLYRVWWYLSYGAENKLFLFISNDWELQKTLGMCPLIRFHQNLSDFLGEREVCT